MSTALTVARQPMPFSDMERLGEYIAKSGLFGIKTKEAAIVLMSIAQAEGRHPVEAARDYDIVNNRPAKRAEAMMRDFIQAGGKIEWHSLTDTVADATFSHPQTGSVRIDWDMKRAETAFGKKDMYTKFPRQMLRSRVVSEGVRTLWPLATSGMYEPGEAADIPPEHNGPTIEHSHATLAAGAASDEREQMNRDVPLKAAASDVKRAPRISEPPPKRAASEARQSTHVQGDIYDQHNIAIELLDVDDSRTWMSNLEMLLAEATSLKAVEVIGECESVKRTIEKAPGSVRARVSELLANACTRFIENDPDQSAEELPDVEIAGAEKLAAGD